MDAFISAFQQVAIILLHKRQDGASHPPCCFICHRKLLLQLFCGNSGSGMRHEEHAEEPCSQRSSCFGKDRVREGIGVVAATLAGVCGSLADFVMHRDLFAAKTKHAVGIPEFFYFFKACLIIGKPREELRESKSINHKLLY